MLMDLNYYISQLKFYASYFKQKRMINDIYTNSKIYEVVIAEQLQHTIINGHANSSDARDSLGNIYEYKHYKKTSSNHTWTFNDFSESTIQNISNINYVIFAEIDDTEIIPHISKMYKVPSKIVCTYLYKKTPQIKNKRLMINISPHQIESEMQFYPATIPSFSFSNELKKIFETANAIEQLTNISSILTSNKLWELLVGMKLGHTINPEQYKHDAVDQYGKTYEYKVYTRMSWSFQDISDRVLNGYLNDEAIILAIVDKQNFIVKKLYICNPDAIVKILYIKLQNKQRAKKKMSRLKETITQKDLTWMLSNNYAYELL